MALHKPHPAPGKPHFVLQNIAKHAEESMKKSVTALSFSAPFAAGVPIRNPANENKPRQNADGACFSVFVRHQAGRLLWAFTHCSV
jgi:hypothetical protein